MTLIRPFKVTNGQTDYAIWFASHDFLLVFYRNYSAISHGNPVFQPMTVIWPLKVTKGQTDNAIWSATYHFLLVFYSNYSAISLGNHVFQQMTLNWSRRVPRISWRGYKVLKCPSQPNAARGSGEPCKLPQRGLGRSPSRQRFWRLLDYNEDVWCNIISNLHRKLLFEI